MRFIARFAMRGPFHAAAVAAAALLCSLSVGLLIVISGATVTLATLRQGSREGLRVMVLATALAVSVRLVMDGQTLPMLILCLVVWLPAWLLAINLARTRRQALPLLMIAVLVAAYAVAIRLAVGDVGAFWSARLEPLFALLAEDGGARFSAEQIAFVADQVHVWSLIAMFNLLAAIVLLGRWWQAELFNPGGFGSEFRELSLPRITVLVAGLTAVTLIGQSAAGMEHRVAGDVFVIVVVLFAFQGLAVIHFRARAIGLAGGWLTALYILLLLTPQIVGPVLATTGVADGLADFRRLKTAPREGGEDGKD